MSINLIKIQGTDTISSSRITINSNFTVVENYINELSDIIDIKNGKIILNNQSSEFIINSGTIRSNLTVGGNLTVSGKLSINSDITFRGSINSDEFRFGESGDFRIQLSNTNDNYGINLSGNNNTTIDKLENTFDYMILPRVSKLSDLDLITDIHEGALSYVCDDSTNNGLYLYIEQLWKKIKID